MLSFSRAKSEAIILTIITLFCLRNVTAQQVEALYPARLNNRPEIHSPCLLQNDVEVITVRMKNGQYTLVPVTVENDIPLDFQKRQYGKGRQLETDAKDFPELAKTGFHNEKHLKENKTITGKSTDEITKIGRPGQSSAAGFMADDEDIISVLMGDNQQVKRLGLTHPQFARPLFHVWNMALAEYRHEGVKRFPCDQVEAILYNEKEIHIKGEGSRGFQESIFNDEIQGNAQFDIWRNLTLEENTFLKKKYGKLDAKSSKKW